MRTSATIAPPLGVGGNPVDRNQMSLSYTDCNIARDGSVMTREQIKSLRHSNGYCTICPGVPNRIWVDERNKFNPLSRNRVYFAVEGKSLNGVCLACNPEQDPRYQERQREKELRRREEKDRRKREEREKRRNTRRKEKRQQHERGQHERQQFDQRNIADDMSEITFNQPTFDLTSRSQQSDTLNTATFHNQQRRNTLDTVNNFLMPPCDNEYSQDRPKKQNRRVSSGSMNIFDFIADESAFDQNLDDIERPKTNRRGSSGSTNTSNFIANKNGFDQNRYDRGRPKTNGGPSVNMDIPSNMGDNSGFYQNEDDQRRIKTNRRGSSGSMDIFNFIADDSAFDQQRYNQGRPKIDGGNMRVESGHDQHGYDRGRPETNERVSSGNMNTSSFTGDESGFDQHGYNRKQPKINGRGPSGSTNISIFTATKNVARGSSENISRFNANGDDYSSASFYDSHTDGSSSWATGDHSSETKLDNISEYNSPNPCKNIREGYMRNGSGNLKADFSGNDLNPRTEERQYPISHPGPSPSTIRGIHNSDRSQQRNSSLASLPLPFPIQPLIVRQESNPSVVSASSREIVSEPGSISPPTLQEDIRHSETDTLIKDLSGLGDTNLVTEILVRHMEDNKDSARWQEYCFGKIWDLCKDRDEYKTSFISMRAPEHIISAMQIYSNNAIIQEQACGALWALCTNKENRMIVIRAGATPCIIRALMNHIDVLDLVCTAMGCLRTISPETEARKIINEMSGTNYFCKAMTTHPLVPGIQRDACNCLSNCAVNLDKNEVALITDCEIEAISNAMVTHEDEPSVMSGACFVLKNFSFKEHNIRYIRLVDGMVETLEKVSQYCEDTRARRDASIILERIVSTKMDDDVLEDQVLMSISQIMSEDDWIGAHRKRHQIVELMEEYDWSRKILESVFQSLTLLFRQHAHDREMIGGDHIISNVITKMKRFKRTANIQIHGCKFLELMMKRNTNCQQKILEAGGCEALAAASSLHLSNAVVQIVATNILKTLSVEFECWFQLRGLEFSVAQIMKAHTKTPQIKLNCQEIINNFSFHEGG